MENDIYLSDDIKKSYNRLVNSIPFPFRSDQNIQKIVWEALVSHDESYVRQVIEKTKNQFFSQYFGKPINWSAGNRYFKHKDKWLMAKSDKHKTKPS